MKKNLSMILIKKISRSGVKNAPLFSKFGIKKYLPEGKMGFRVLDLNSEKGVKTPRWRILGTKKYYTHIIIDTKSKISTMI